MSNESTEPPSASFAQWFLPIRSNTHSKVLDARINQRLKSPQHTPRSIVAGTRSSIQSLSSWKEKSDDEPTKMYVKHVAVTLEMSIGSNEAIVRSIISTSRVNTRPAIGALNTPAIAADAPQPTRSIIVLLSMWNNLPRLLPMAEPVSTIGASAPTLPPKPIVMADATTELQQLWPFIRLRLRLMA